MTILHIYDESDTMAGRYVEMLMQATHAMTHEGSMFDEQFAMYVCTNAKDCRQLTDEHHPDILHLHGASAPFTLPPGLRLVVTPHGEVLGPVQAYVVVARSPHEANSLQSQFPRVEIVRNPLITRTVTTEDCARQMEAIYQRVMDSSVLQLMDVNKKRLLTATLSVATYGDVHWLPSTFLFNADDANYRQLYLYATHEGVLSLVQQGLTMLGIHAPEAEPVSCYLPSDFLQPKPMPVATIAQLLTDISNHGVSLLRLSELARSLHDDSLDEAKLLEYLDDDGQLSLLGAILPLLADHLLLTEGFMPCTPADGPATQQLRSMLAKRQEL